MEQVQPQAIEIEEAILGALIIEPDSIYKICETLTPKMFYKHTNGYIYEVISTLAMKNIPIDLFTIQQELSRAGQLEAIGGAVYLVTISGKVSNDNHIEFHSKIVQEKYLQRELIKLGQEIQGEAYNPDNIDELINRSQSKLSKLIETSGGTGSEEQSSIVDKAIQEIQADCVLSEQGKSTGVNTGFVELNRALGGWKNTNFIILAARPSVGKTSLALHFAKSAAMTGVWVNFYGLEMTSTDLVRILISGDSGVHRSQIRDGQLNEQDWNKINDSALNLQRLPIIWNDNASLSVNQIKALTVKNKIAGKCGLIIIDYLQLLDPVDKKVNREQQISEISRSLKRLAKSENVPIIALAQLNREAETGRPLLSHLRESGSLEQDSDIVLFPWVEESQYKLTIAKNRRGYRGTFDVITNEEMTYFSDTTRQPQFEEQIKDIEEFQANLEF